MLQGVTGAPAAFQRLMEKAVGDMNLLQVLVYLDDLIVFVATLEEHEGRLLKVLDRLEEVGLKVSLDKCQICRDKVKYVSHIVSADGVSTDPDKVEGVTKWPQPTDLKSFRSFLGFCGYYRRFVANYAAIVKPLTELTKGYTPFRKGQKQESVSDRTYYVESELFGSRRTDSCTEAFCKIIDCLTHVPVLAFADPTRPYVLHVDASQKGLGAVLNQVYPEGLRPITFASRGLSAAEQKYHIHQLEFLSLKGVVVEKFHDYLYGVKFTVVTDNNPLNYVLTTGKLNATEQVPLMEKEVTRWSSHSEATLQAALDDVDWDKFQASSSDVSEFTEVALSLVNMLTEQATETVTIRTFSNQKPWVDRSIHDAVNHRTAAYNAGILSGNMSEYKTSCYTLRHAVRAAKRRYRERIESHFQLNDACGRD